MQEMTSNPDWLNEIEVSAPRIQRYLRSLLIDVDIDDEGYLFLKDGLEHPAWVYIDAPRTLVQLVAQVPLQPDEGLQAAAVNELNRTYIGVQFHTLYGKLWGNAWLSYKTGMCLRHLAHIVPLFCSAVLHAVHEPCIRHLVQREFPGRHH